MKKYFKALLFILITQSAGALGALFTVSNIESWYVGLTKPALTPPNWLFGPAWIILYTLLGISAFLIWERMQEDKRAKNAIVWFFVHLFLNAIWTPVFFGAHLVLTALFVIILVFVTGVIVSVKFCKISKLAGYLWVPYLAWIVFATYLNSGIYLLN